MERKFKILATGNFYFPALDTNKKFIVLDTIDLEINMKNNKVFNHLLKKEFWIFKSWQNQFGVSLKNLLEIKKSIKTAGLCL
ncbi:hypothetical protein FJZ19_02215 [Candidatus Pacearchaeota archaeon]|nr:hypothetical protein [Candidatus Pacearchaeota archaeon]